MSSPRPRVESFIIRFVEDAPDSRVLLCRWHGVVVHVQTNTEHSFNRLADAIAFIARYVSVGNFVFKAGAGAPKKNQREGGDRSSIPRNHPQHDDQLPTKL